MSASQVAEASKPWQGWEDYPANLPPSICSPFVYDIDFICERLARDSSRLFITEDRIRICVIEVGVGGKCLILRENLLILTLSGLHRNRHQERKGPRTISPCMTWIHKLIYGRVLDVMLLTILSGITQFRRNPYFVWAVIISDINTSNANA